MKLTLNNDGSVDVVSVEADRIDASVAVEFKDAFRSSVADGDGPVVLDLTNVSFLDSSGLGAVVAARKLLGDDRKLDLAGLQAPVAKVMQLTRMDTVFLIHDTPAAARDAYRSPAA